MPKRKSPRRPAPLQVISDIAPEILAELLSPKRRPKHRPPRSAIELSWDLLTPAMRVLELMESCGKTRKEAKEQVMGELGISRRTLEASLACCKMRKKDTRAGE
jgi:hypothetical protein